MRQQALLTITLLLISMSLFSQNNRNTYKKEWTEVNAITHREEYTSNNEGLCYARGA